MNEQGRVRNITDPARLAGFARARYRVHLPIRS